MEFDVNGTTGGIGAAIIGGLLYAANYFRGQRKDAAATNAAVAASRADQVASESLAAQITQLTATVSAQGKKIDELQEELAKLNRRVSHSDDVRKMAIRRLKLLHLCEKCLEVHDEVLKEAIDILAQPHEDEATAE